MSTLKHLDLAVIDIRNTLMRDLQFGVTAKAQIAAAFNTLAESVEHAEAVVNNAIDERNRALELALGIVSERQEPSSAGEAESNVVPAKRKAG